MCHTQDFCIEHFSLRCFDFNLVKNEIIKGPVWWPRWRVLGGGLPQMSLRNFNSTIGMGVRDKNEWLW